MNLSSELPLYEAIKRDLKARMENGELPEGTRILPEIELAKQVGVSRSTARKALQALEMEGYLSRTAGRGSFVKACTSKSGAAGTARKTLAVTLMQIERFNHAGEILQGFLNTTVTSGYHGMVHPQRAPGTNEYEYLVNVHRTGIQGWALWLARASQKSIVLLQNFQQSGGALVLVDRYVPSLESDYVVTKNAQMGYDLTRALIQRGHEHIALINFLDDNTVAADRQAGYTRALVEAGLPVIKEHIVSDRMAGTGVLRMQLLALLGMRKRPTAIFCATAHHAWFLAAELQRLGYGIPHDIQIAAVHDNPMAGQVDFPMLTATQHSYAMGCRAAQLLQERLEHPELPWQQVELEYALNFTPEE